MLSRHNRLVATLFALSLVGAFSCKDDDSGGDGDSGSDGDDGTADDGSDDGGTGSDDGGTGSDDGGTGSDDGGTETGGDGGTGTDTGDTGTGDTGTGDTGTGDTGTGGTGTGSAACDEMDDREECMGTWGCDWQGGPGGGNCVPFDGDCTDFPQQHCEAMVDCVWNAGDEECTNA
jgi:hypothetical protein